MIQLRDLLENKKMPVLGYIIALGIGVVVGIVIASLVVMSVFKG